MFTDVETLRYCTLKVLPLVYDDALSYAEVQGKIVKKLNELIKNNNEIPSYIRELIKTYISSGEIDNIIAEILSDYMLSVKNPPENLKPAVGDGSADDTEAIQGCLDYAKAHHGMCVYFPSGAYLTSTLTLPENSDVTMFGQGRYVTRLVLRGGATEAMLKGSVKSLTLTGLMLDGNGDIQVNNVDLIKCDVVNASISQCILTDGFNLLDVNASGNVQISHVIFDHAIEKGLIIRGTGNSHCDNVIFNTISSLVGKEFFTLESNNNVIKCSCIGDATKLFTVSGNRNYIEIDSISANVDSPTFSDTGEQNTIKVSRITIKDALKNIDITSENTKVNTGVTNVESGDTTIKTATVTINSGNVDATTINLTVHVNGITNITAGEANVTIDKVTITSGSTSVAIYDKNIVASADKIDLTANSFWIKGKKVEGSYGTPLVIRDFASILVKVGDFSVESGLTATSPTTIKAKNMKVSCTENITEDCASKTVTTGGMDIDSTTPIKYKTPVQSPTTEFFDYIPMLDREGNTINVMVENAKTKRLASTTENNVLIIGDSYADGYTAAGFVTGFPELMAQYAGWTVDKTYWHEETGGAGFGKKGGADFTKDFNQLTTDAYNRMDDVQRLSIKKILYAGGWNDADVSQSNIMTGMKNTFANARQKFPNAEIYVAMIGWSVDYSKREQIISNALPAYTKCGKYGGRYITNSEYIMHNYAGISRSDNQHPNEENQDLLATYLLNGLQHGTCDIQYRQTVPFHINEAVVKKISSLGVITLSNGITSWNIGRITIDFDYAKKINGGDVIQIATVDENCLVLGGTLGSNKFSASVNGYMQDQTGGTKFYDFNGVIAIDNGQVRLSFDKIKADNTGYQSYDTPYQANIDVATIATTSIEC
nr:MAG TPA: Pectate lyase [Caudoviricetes sp.]